MKDSLVSKKIIVFLGVVGLSFSGIFAAIFDAPSVYIVLWRMIFSVLILSVPFAREFGKEKALFTPRLLIVCVSAGAVLAVHFASFFEAVRNASVASAALLVNTSVFFVPLITVPFMGEKLNAKAIAGMIITFAGSAVVAMGDAGGGNNALFGDAMAVLGAICMSVYTILGKVARRSLSTTVYTTIVYFIAAIASFLFVVAQGIPLAGYGLTNYGCALGMAVFCTILGHSLLSWGLKYVSASLVSTIKLAEPPCAAVLAFIIFRQIPSVATVVGGIIIILGVYLTIKNTD